MSTTHVRPDQPAPPRLGRIAGAALAGTTIEFYDFFILGTATALVSGSVFFAELGGARGTLALGATHAVAFLARPFGSVLFGHIGDRQGRKQTLVYTLVLIGGSTFAIDCIPRYDSIGIAAPIILVTLRFLQGLAVGGEWAGAAVLTSEFAPPKRAACTGCSPSSGRRSRSGCRRERSPSSWRSPAIRPRARTFRAGVGGSRSWRASCWSPCCRDAAPCGSAHSMIADIHGRLDDYFHYAAPGATVPVHPHLFRSALGARPSIVEYQVRQRPHGTTIAVRSLGPFDRAGLATEIAAALRRLGCRIRRFTSRSWTASTAA